jgi:hypothetical protein
MAAVSQSAIVSPSPAILSFVAVVSSLLGAVLKAAVASPPPAQDAVKAVTPREAFTSIVEQLVPAESLCKC